MRSAMKEAFDPELLNDLAVVEHQLGRRESAEGILRTCLARSPGDTAAKENLAAIAGGDGVRAACDGRSEEHTSELQSPVQLVCGLLLEETDAVRERGDMHEDGAGAGRGCGSA